MSISVDPELETKLRARADAEGLTIQAYLERVLRTEQQGLDDLEVAAIEGIESGTR